ncbi:Mss4-like protein [Corynascus novoguineensis]|uniref:Mss4-like protein n=1 Tax=Corynascus novoguineensis TaxID=1126955 RepID=A0AAN7HHE6_9PEZI|nr:Mss4-like protein [Corynascus novoguineensis]
MDDVQDSCLCEGVKFFVTGAPDTAFKCYCSHCSKTRFAKFKREAVQVVEGTELMSTYILTDDLSGSPKHKVFCSRCGCTLWTIPMKHHGTHWILRTAIIKDGLEKLPYKSEFFASRMKAVAAPDGVRRFDTMPGQ